MVHILGLRPNVPRRRPATRPAGRLDGLRRRAARGPHARSSPTPSCRPGSCRPPGRPTSSRTTRPRTASSSCVFDGAGPRRRSTSARTPSPGACPGSSPGAITAGAALPAGPDPVPAPPRGRAWSALFVLVDGMFFVQSRIGMNDVYVGLFIVAAYTRLRRDLDGLVAGPRRRSGLAMPIVGLLLGLALASKWVAAYAIGALAPPAPRPQRARPRPGDPRPDRDHDASSATWRSASPRARGSAT